MRGLAWLVAAAAIGACYGPDLGPTPFSCPATNRACPDGYTCDLQRGVCVQVGTPDGAPLVDDAAPDDVPIPPIDAAPDARPIDASIPDAPPPDAMPIDVIPPDAGPPDAFPPDATVCAPDESLGCVDADTLLRCGSTGVGTVTEECVLGCNSTATPNRCNALEPSNLAAATCEATSAVDMTVMMPRTLDLSSECTSVVVQGSGNPDLCVIVVRDLVVMGSGTLTASGTRVPVIVATRDVTIDGVIDVSADFGAAGPGGTSGPASGGSGTMQLHGGGGGGHSAFGAAAGTGGGGGGTAGDSDLSPLVPAGRGGNGGGAGASGGGNGGLIQIVACRTMTIGGTAVLDAGGGGGTGGAGTGFLSLPADGGGGGGAGGGILLEGARILFGSGAQIVANGGAAGEGGVAVAVGDAIAGEAGENGLRSTTAANGGDGAGTNAGDGGDGGAVGSPTTGASGVSNSGHGGGGGAAGRIRLNRAIGIPIDTTGVTISPATTPGTLSFH